MPLQGKIRSWIWEDVTDTYGGGPATGPIALDLFDDVKLWALIANEQIIYTDVALVGLQASFEV